MATSFLVPKNSASGTLASAITNIETSVALTSGDGANFPSSFPYNIVVDLEIMQVTARSTDTLTVTRAQESTSGAAHLAAAAVELNVTAGYVSQIQTAVTALEAGILADGATIGTSPNQATFASDGFMIATGTARWERQVNLIATNFGNPSANPPTRTLLSNGITEVETFANGKQTFGTWEYPVDYIEGTEIHLHIHWAPTTANTGQCDWALDYLITDAGDDIDAAGTTDTGFQQAGGGVADVLQQSPDITISGTGVEVEDFLHFRIYRDASDAFTGDGQLISLDVHYQSNRHGGDEQW